MSLTPQPPTESRNAAPSTVKGRPAANTAAASPARPAGSWFVTYSKPILIVLGILAVVVVAGAILNSRRAEKNAQARDAFYAARQLVDEEIKTLAPPVKPADPKKKADPQKAPAEGPEATETGAYKKVAVESTFSKGLPALKKLIADYPGTLSAFQAEILIGNLYANHGSLGEAVSHYTRATDIAPQPLEKMGALYALAQAQESLGKCNESVQTLDRALALGVGPLKGDLLIAQARCYETLQNPAKAKGIYDQVLKDLPGTPFAKLAELYRAKLN